MSIELQIIKQFSIKSHAKLRYVSVEMNFSFMLNKFFLEDYRQPVNLNTMLNRTFLNIPFLEPRMIMTITCTHIENLQQIK